MKKRVALITGASSGIGKELAKIHAERGGDLVVVARSEDKLNKLKAELEKKHSVSVTVIAQDLSKQKSAKTIYDQINKEGITIDYLINNAGFGGIGKFHERSLKDDTSMINLNVMTLVNLTHYFLQDFVERNQGKILNVSSTASLMAGPMQAVYFATKAFVTSFSNAIAEELHDTKVTVTNLMPGATKTEFGKVSGMDKTELFKSAASARRVAEEGYNGMLQGKLDVISGLSVSQKMLISMIPVAPKQVLLTQIRKLQQVK